MKCWELVFKRSLPKVSEKQAIAIAQDVCHQNGWWWGTPVKIVHRRKTWIIYTHWNMRGANARFKIDSETGEVKEAVYLPR